MELPRYVVIDKPRGRTPLQAVLAWKDSHPRFKDVPATYAGRLDPLATGKLLILLGRECRNRDFYSRLDKEYEIEVLLDFSSDTGDPLGLPLYTGHQTHPERELVRKAMSSLMGARTLPYPAFSSKTVSGKPLFQYALEGSLSSIEIPTHEERIYRSVLGEEQRLPAAQVRARIASLLEDIPRNTANSKALGADFRQDAIREAWAQLLDALPSSHAFSVYSLRVTCASGTYMRTYAMDLARALGTSGLALSIHRTRIGRYRSMRRWGLWIRQW